MLKRYSLKYVLFFFKKKSLQTVGKFGLSIRNQNFKVFQLLMLLKSTPNAKL